MPLGEAREQEPFYKQCRRNCIQYSADPLSIYAVAEKTYVDGVPYWDMEKDLAKQKALKADEGRLIQKMIDAKKTNNQGIKNNANPVNRLCVHSNRFLVFLNLPNLSNFTLPKLLFKK